MIERFLDDALREKMLDPDVCSFMTVLIPGDIGPMERHHRFTVYLDAELRMAGLGCSVGGGTLYFDDEDEDESAAPEIAYCLMDVDAVVIPQSMPFMLLGNSFLTRFQMTRDNDQMTLTKRY